MAEKNRISFRRIHAPRRSYVLLLACALAGCTDGGMGRIPHYRYLDSPPDVRVLVVSDARKLSISTPTGSVVVAGRKATRCSGPGTVSASVHGGRIQFDGKDTGFTRIRIMAPVDSQVWVAGRAYCGEIAIVVSGNVMSVINTVNIEDYVAGVVSGEMPMTWDEDALGAQAVAARSFALNEKKIWAARRDFDLYADERSQVYLGATRMVKAIRAAEATRGVILVWNWNIFPAFYHSACGGGTRRGYPVLSRENIAPLVGVKCSYCGDIDTTWRKAVSPGDLEALLALPGRIKKVSVRKDKTGGKVAIEYDGGVTALSSHRLRTLVGPRVLRSPGFTVRRAGDSWVFTGKGFGHGVGMCQYGARGMAAAGFNWTGILRHYYPGADLVRIY